MVGPLDQDTFLESGADANEGDQMGAFTALQRAWADSTSLNATAIPAAREPGPFVTRWRSRTVANVDSIELVARRWTQYSAGCS